MAAFAANTASAVGSIVLELQEWLAKLRTQSSVHHKRLDMPLALSEEQVVDQRDQVLAR